MKDKIDKKQAARARRPLNCSTAREQDTILLSQCPTCYQLNGEHLYDCPQRMFGTGIRNLKQREKAMLAALGDDYE